MTGTQLQNTLKLFGVTKFTKTKLDEISTIQLKSNNSLYMAKDKVWTIDASRDLILEYLEKQDKTLVLYAVYDIATVFGVTGASHLHPHGIQMFGGIL